MKWLLEAFKSWSYSCNNEIEIQGWKRHWVGLFILPWSVNLNRGGYHFWWDTHVLETATLSWRQQNQTHVLNPTSVFTNLVRGEVVRGSRVQWRMLRGCVLTSFQSDYSYPSSTPHHVSCAQSPEQGLVSSLWKDAGILFLGVMLAEQNLQAVLTLLSAQWRRRASTGSLGP